MVNDFDVLAGVLLIAGLLSAAVAATAQGLPGYKTFTRPAAEPQAPALPPARAPARPAAWVQRDGEASVNYLGEAGGGSGGGLQMMQLQVASKQNSSLQQLTTSSERSAWARRKP